MVRIFIAIAISQFITLSIVAGALTTKNNQIFTGDLQFDKPGFVTIASKEPGGFALSFSIEQIQSMRLREELQGQLSGDVLPGGWAVSDIGPNGMAGSANYSQGEFTLRAEGVLRDELSDSNLYLHHHIAADCNLTLRVQSLSGKDSDRNDLDELASTGICMRRSTTATDPFIAIAVTAGKGIQFIKRDGYSQKSTAITIPGTEKIKAPCWLKMTRSGYRLSTAYSMDGKKWQFANQANFDVMRGATLGTFVSSHRAEQLATAVLDHVRLTINGIEGQFFADPKFKDMRMSRLQSTLDYSPQLFAPEVNLPTLNYAMRFSGQLTVPTNDVYHFYLPCQTAGRLYINDKIILDTASKTVRPGIVTMKAGERYELRVDYIYKDKGAAQCRLLWSRTTEPDAKMIPNEHLFYVPPTEPAAEVTAVPKPVPTITMPTRGVMLVDGTFLPGTVAGADGKGLQFSYRDRAPMEIPLAKASWLIFRTLKENAVNKVPPKSVGLLTFAGDFVEGECSEIKDGKAKVTSVVFGISSFDIAEQVGAIIYREPTITDYQWTIRTINGGSIHAKSFKTKDQSLMVDEPVLGEFEIRMSEITTIEKVDRKHPNTQQDEKPMNHGITP